MKNTFLILSFAAAMCLLSSTLNSCTDMNADNREDNTVSSSDGNLSDDDNAGLFMDGMFFGKNGQVESAIKATILDSGTEIQYFYDSDGRISRTVQTSVSERATSTITFEYEYSYKKIVMTTTNVTDYTDDTYLEDSKTVSTTVTEYY